MISSAIAVDGSCKVIRSTRRNPQRANCPVLPRVMVPQHDRLAATSKLAMTASFMKDTCNPMPTYFRLSDRSHQSLVRLLTFRQLEFLRGPEADGIIEPA